MKIKTMNLAFYIAFILTIGTFCFIAYVTNNEQLEEEYIQMEITANETVWEIAEKYSNNHNLSTWEFVKWVEDKNKIDADHIAIGTALILPIEKNEKNEKDNSYMVVAEGQRSLR
ncbi:LysM peptidoglycan-binding domain-containing protein [Bacillus sp. BGMRC 2118]|nr:LysM peptidoglycan-binding domain-containing protein [Bacillus sp. BGMRC 2118]